MKFASDTRIRDIYKVTLVGGAVNALLLIFKFIAGILAGSAAMIADAVHSLSDFATDIIVFVFVRISNKPQDSNHDYGHGKYETLATTIIGLALLAVGIGIICKGIVSIVAWAGGNDLTSPGNLALWAALVSIASKELLFRYTVHEGRRLKSKAVIANAWHHRSDALSSIGTAAGIGGAIFLGGRWTVLDPVASVIVGCVIAKISVKLILDGLKELVEHSLPEETENEIRDIVSAYPLVTDPHDLRTRQIGNHYAIELHVRMDGDTTLKAAHDCVTDIEKSLRERFGQDTHISIHMEPEGEND